MGKFVFFMGIIFLLLQACSSDSAYSKKKGKKKDLPSFIQMNTVFTESERNVSFPIWFNDSMVKGNHISKITRSFYLVEENDEGYQWELTNEIPREKREYWFTPEGHVKQLNVSYYYDNQVIGNVSFLYDGTKDENGFSKVKQGGDKDFQWDASEDNSSFYFYIHKKVKTTTKYLAYQNDQTGDYLFYMLNKKFWGPLSIDTILQPTPKDIVVLGKPYKPNKIYRVQNKVSETDVQLFEYKDKKHRIATITRLEYPFDHKRTLLYTKNGTCNGYIDSTFSIKKYLNRTISEIDFNAKKLPVKISHKKESQLNNSSLVSIELLKYE